MDQPVRGHPSCTCPAEALRPRQRGRDAGDGHVEQHPVLVSGNDTAMLRRYYGDLFEFQRALRQSRHPSRCRVATSGATVPQFEQGAAARRREPSSQDSVSG